MKITDVRVIVTCPLRQPFVLVKIVTDEGVYGVGEGTKMVANWQSPNCWKNILLQCSSGVTLVQLKTSGNFYIREPTGEVGRFRWRLFLQLIWRCGILRAK